jgi:citrate synthase
VYDCVNIDRTINTRRATTPPVSGVRPWVSAEEAAALLGVSRATLYAYVSRGFIRSQPTAGQSRHRGYARDDVERLRRRTEERRNPDKAAGRALQWGMPILESSIALIDSRRLYYRGHDVAALARSRSVEEIASLVWTGRFDATLSSPAAARRPWAGNAAKSSLPFAARAQTALAAAGARDPLAFDVRPGRVAVCGWRILQLLAAIAAGQRQTADGVPIERLLARAWRIDAGGADVMRSALVLCADHELNVSSFTARCVASAGSNPYSVVIAALAALEGPRHGGASARVAAMLDAMRAVRKLRRAVTERLGRGEPLDGFGHPLYPDGDPRAAMLMALLRERYPKSAELAYVENVAEAGASATG